MPTCVECGSRWVGWKVKGVRKYRDPAADKERICHQSPKYINADNIEQRLIDLLPSVELPHDWQKRVLDHFSEEQDTTPVIRQRVATEGRMTLLRELYIAGDISKDQYERRREEFENELNSLRSLNAQGIDVRRMGELVQNFNDLWKEANKEERKKLFQTFYRNVYIEGGEIKAVEPTSVLWVLLDTVMFVETGRIGAHSNIFLPVKPLNSSIVYHFLNANSLAPFITNPN